MAVPIRFQQVPLARIDLSEAAVEMAAAPALDRLAASLQEVGLINPPWLRPQPGGQRFHVVTGAKRLQAATRLGWSGRGIHRALKVARTIADLAGSDTTLTAHVAEAVQYRRALHGAK